MSNLEISRYLEIVHFQSRILEIEKTRDFRNTNLNSTDNDGNTAFHDACIDGNVNVVKLLLTNAKEKEITIPKAEKIKEYNSVIQQLILEYAIS